MKLDKTLYNQYLYKTYSSWLGKIIGIRLGAPVEGFTREKILNTYKNRDSYLIDYDIFASDDDSNGPLFFVRALLDKNDISAKDVGDTFLNYIQEYRGFFWWGGVGVSSEHTAYENLKNGICAPLSGSYKQNGIEIAEQIGGQIFSDCWGYVSLYDADLAKKLATYASSVTHDKDGIEGGVFVAVCICLAYQMDDIHQIIDKALTYIDNNSHYYKVAKDIISFYEHSDKEDYTKCFDYIYNNYGYDKYPGVCHIIPNMALMIMAMCYGDGDFSKTLIMLNDCGWDTDCNCGNVGSILGALNGVNNIDEKWITPINDIVNSSSLVGSLNIDTVSSSAKLFTYLAFKLKGIEVNDDHLFDLPYATSGFRFGEVKDNKLYVSLNEVYKYSYYLKDDIYDARYDPEFSSILYPGDTLKFKVLTNNIRELSVFVDDCDGNRYTSEKYTINGSGELSFVIPSHTNMVINKFGIISNGDYYILDYKIESHPKVDYDFTNNYQLEHYGPRYGGDYMNNIRNFVTHSGDWTIDNCLVGKSNEHGLISTGSINGTYNELEWTFEMAKGDGHFLVFNMSGYLHFEAIGIKNNELVYFKKDVDVKELKKTPILSKNNEKITLKMTYSDGKINASIEGEKLLDFASNKIHGLYGILLENNCINNTFGLKVR